MKKAYRVKLTVTAQADISHIWDYIAQDSPLAARDFIEQIESKILSLSENPERHPIIPESGYLQTSQYRHLIYRNYRIVYRVEMNDVFVLRIFHGAKLFDLTIENE